MFKQAGNMIGFAFKTLWLVQVSYLKLVPRPSQNRAQLISMITDVQLSMFPNVLGVSLFLLVVLYHYMAVNHPRSRNESGTFSAPGFQDIV